MVEGSKQDGKVFSCIGLALFLMIVIRVSLQLIFKDISAAGEKSWGWYALYIFSTYLVGLPFVVLILRRIPSAKIEVNNLKSSQFFGVLIVCLFITYSGGIAGKYADSLISTIAGRQMADLTSKMLNGSNFWASVTVIGIIGPVIEEFIFRKLLISKLRIYGEWIAVLISALAFGLSHGNFDQFIYVFPTGLAFGYIYVKTGNLIYSIAIHITINMLSVFVFAFRNSAFIMRSYGAVILAIMIAGLVLLIVNRNRIHFNKSIREITDWKRTAFLNPGMLLFFASCAALFAYETYAALYTGLV